MPPQSSLPLRDGRVGLPSTSSFVGNSSQQQQQQQQQQQNEPNYSDEDIELLHDIVILGESILPTLPERDRLPTNALFQAAEQVLPAHGYDADQAPSHIARLIFKIGGQRSGGTLGDKFRSVLEGMGIKLVYDESSPLQQSPAARSASTRSYGASDNETGTETETGNFNANLRRVPRRRHSSVSRPAERMLAADDDDEQTYDLPIRPRLRPRARSVSFTDHSTVPGDALQPNDGAINGRGARLGQNNNDGDKIRQSIEGKENHDIPSWRAARANAHVPGRIASRGFYPDEEQSESEDATQDAPIRPYQANFPTMERVRNFPRGFGVNHNNADDSEPEPEPEPELEEDKEQGGPPSTVGDTDHIHHSPRTEASDLDRGASDTSVQTKDEHFLPYEDLPPADTEYLEAKLRMFAMEDAQKLVQDAFVVWCGIARATRREHEKLMRLAAEFDDDDMVVEVLEIWNEEAIVMQEERMEAQVAAEHAAYVAKMERRANRSYEIFTIRNALLHWQDRAQDEVDRTAVARRHLVRKRAFDSWRAQHVADEAKVHNFILINALQKWTQVALHHEVREHVAVQHYENNIARHALGAIWEQHKGRLADYFRCYRLVEECLGLWYVRAREAVDEDEVAVALDERLLLYEAVNIWREEAEDLQYTAYECTMQELKLDLKRTLAYWQDQARLERLLKQHKAATVESLQYRSLEIWRSAAHDARRDTKNADAWVLKQPIEHWRRETKLKVFIRDTETKAKSEALYHWVLEERLAWYTRHLETETKRQTLNALLTSSRQVRNTHGRYQQEVDYVLTYYRQAECLDTWLAGIETMWRHRHNADLISTYRTTRPCLERWRERHTRAVARASYYQREADQNARRLTVANVLDRWPRIAVECRRERLLNTLRDFRRNYKTSLAQSCLAQWSSAAADSIEASHDAYAVHVEHKREEVNDFLTYWSHTARKSRNIKQIAADAEIEVYCTKWQTHHYEAHENMLDASYYDTDKTLGQCWRVWEFQALQHEGLRHTVAAVQDKTEQRMCRHILEEWHRAAVPDVAMTSYLDPRFSTLSRRSLRQQQHSILTSTPLPAPAPPPVSILDYQRPERHNNNRLRNTTANILETPLRPVSQLGNLGAGSVSRRFGASTQSLHLGPMAEFDEDSLLPDVESNDPGFMSTPTKRTGGVRQLGYRPTTTPSAILASPYERELRQVYAGSATGTGTGVGTGTGRRVEFKDFANITEDSAEG
ncbi:Sfi1 spindle body protein-domain-containing protein [Cercophora scortea]|uniref:Sfi1 spindle body protein-domain-containing protein n=1 Tax=Cercophora scortea TaxID=314031 RepID=A0AAE0I9U5_9PEZI|nr:Sfi1 spindle body protein-domain-containing protein [Cercophora scortea]